MIAGFVIWSAVFVLLLGIGVWTRRSGKAAGFYTGVKPPEVTDRRAYNRSVSRLWFIYAVLFELLGVPFFFMKGNPALIAVTVFGVAAITVGLIIAYNRILRKYRKE